MMSSRVILIGRDNRESGSEIVKILISGIYYGEKVFGKVKFIDMGIICTATLAWCVRFAKVDQEDYYKNLSNNWDLLITNIKQTHINNNLDRGILIIDTAQGSFSTKTEFLKNSLIKLGISTQFYHCDHLKPINDECGSNYVMSKKLPREICKFLQIQ